MVFGPQNSFSFDLVFNKTFIENNEFDSYARPAFYKTINRIDNNTIETCNVFGEREYFYFKNSTDDVKILTIGGSYVNIIETIAQFFVTDIFGNPIGRLIDSLVGNYE